MPVLSVEPEESTILQIRITRRLRERLRRQAYREDQPISVVARRYILEGLRRKPVESA